MNLKKLQIVFQVGFMLYSDKVEYIMIGEVWGVNQQLTGKYLKSNLLFKAEYNLNT